MFQNIQHMYDFSGDDTQNRLEWCSHTIVQAYELQYFNQLKTEEIFMFDNIFICG